MLDRSEIVRIAYRHAAVALNSYRDHSLDDELDAEGGPWTAEEREQLDVELEKIQAYLEDVADPPGPEASDHLPADHPAPVATSDAPPARKRRRRRRRSNGTGTVADAMGLVTGPAGHVFHACAPTAEAAVRYIPVPIERGMIARYCR